MSDAPRDAREEAAEQALRARGVADARVEAVGHQREIAVLSLPAGAWEPLLSGASAELVAAVKAAGFRYVALDLEPDQDGQ